MMACPKLENGSSQVFAKPLLPPPFSTEATESIPWCRQRGLGLMQVVGVYIYQRAEVFNTETGSRERASHVSIVSWEIIQKKKQKNKNSWTWKVCKNYQIIRNSTVQPTNVSKNISAYPKTIKELQNYHGQCNFTVHSSVHPTSLSSYLRRNLLLKINAPILYEVTQ